MNHCIKFKFLKNRAIDLGDDREYRIRFEMRAVPTGQNQGALRHSGGIFSTGSEPIKPHYFMDDEFKVTLQNESPMVPSRSPEMTEKYYEKIIDEAVTKSLAARAANEIIRARIKIFEESGTIEVTSDDFATTLEPYKNKESANISAESNSHAR